MIFQTVTTGKQMALRGWSCTTPAKAITIPTEESVVEFCTCNFFCDYTEKVFADTGDKTDEYKNDYKSILIDLKDETSTFEFFLVKPNGEEVALNNNTYGTFYDKGFNSVQPLKAGFNLDWVEVLEEFGEGQYSIKINQTDFGNTITVETHKFQLMNWSENRSDLTVKIEFVQSGKILNGTDFSGMEWSNMIRVEGRFGNHKPQYEINRLQDSNYEDIDVQVQTFNNYQLRTLLIPSSVGDLISENLVLTDDIKISVNDVFSYKQYRQIPVTFEGTIDNSDDFARNSMKFFTITFKDKISKLKRNFS